MGRRAEAGDGDGLPISTVQYDPTQQGAARGVARGGGPRVQAVCLGPRQETYGSRGAAAPLLPGGGAGWGGCAAGGGGGGRPRGCSYGGGRPWGGVGGGAGAGAGVSGGRGCGGGGGPRGARARDGSAGGGSFVWCIRLQRWRCGSGALGPGRQRADGRWPRWCCGIGRGPWGSGEEGHLRRRRRGGIRGAAPAAPHAGGSLWLAGLPAGSGAAAAGPGPN